MRAPGTKGEKGSFQAGHPAVAWAVTPLAQVTLISLEWRLWSLSTEGPVGHLDPPPLIAW